MTEQLYIIRKALPEDISFIYSSWLKSFRYGSTANKLIRTNVFFTNYREVLDSILAKSLTLVACLPDSPEVILGYMVYEEDILHYCFIKHSFRRLGIASSLLEQTGLKDSEVQVTHMTNELSGFFDTLILVKGLKLEYNPFLLYDKGL